MSLWGVKSARVGSCARAAPPGVATTGEPQGHVARGTWPKMFANSYLKQSQAGLTSCLPLALYKEVKFLWGIQQNTRNHMVIMNP